MLIHSQLTMRLFGGPTENRTQDYSVQGSRFTIITISPLFGGVIQPRTEFPMLPA